nr:hypothetical protein [Glycomyces sp. YM15]
MGCGLVESRQVGVGQLGIDGFALRGDVADLGGEFVGGPVGVAKQVQDLVLQGVESGAFAFEVAAQGLRGPLIGPGDLLEPVPGPARFVGRERDGGVVGAHCGLDITHGEPREIAGAVLVAAHAEVVEVEAAGLGLGALDDQAAPAAPAPDEAFEVVVPLAFAHARAALLGEHGLDLVEQGSVDEGFVPAGVGDAVEGDGAEVVRVGEDLPDLVDRDGSTGRMLSGGPGLEPGGSGDFAEFLEGVLSRGVSLEERFDDRGAFGIEGDGADFATVNSLPDVQVPEGRATGCAASGGFCFHLVGDVLPRDARLVLVEPVDHMRHQIPGGRVVGGVLHRQDRDAEAAEFAFGESGVGGVAEQPRAHVYHDEVDIALIANPPHHLAECRATVN